MSDRGQIVGFETPVIDGIKIPRHPLDRAARKLLAHARLLLRDIEGIEGNEPEAARMLTAKANAVNAASRAILGLMAEHRELASIAATRGALTDEEYRAQIGPLVLEHVERMSDDALINLYEKRFGS